MEEDQTRQDDMMGRRRGDGTSELGRFGKKKSVVCRLVGNPWRVEKRRVKQRPRPVFTLCVRRVRSFPPARRVWVGLEHRGSGAWWSVVGGIASCGCGKGALGVTPLSSSSSSSRTDGDGRR